MSAFTRGHLPARVYWTRRLVLVATAALLVFGIGRVLTNGSNGSSGPDRAVQAGSDTSTSPASTGQPTKTRHPHHAKTSAGPTLAAPTGPCSDSDVNVMPSVPKPIAGGDIKIALDLSSRESPACTWEVSPRTLTLKVTSGADEIWTTRECPNAVPTRSVTVRQTVVRRIHLVWNAKRSDSTCSALTQWAVPGYYHIRVAALGGEPQDVQFQLDAPTAAEVTRTVTAHPTKHHQHHKRHPKHAG
ncbi:MAG: hypothetical protein ACR2K3_09745 [Nocardioides sp.]